VDTSVGDAGHFGASGPRKGHAMEGGKQRDWRWVLAFWVVAAAVAFLALPSLPGLNAMP